MYFPRILFAIFLLVSLASADRSSSAMESQEETYSISLVQSADTDKEVREIDGRRIVTEKHRVRPGDHLWKIMREKGLLQKHGLREVLQLLKALNPSLKNIDLLHPGETLVIPLSLTPKSGPTTPPRPAEPPVPVKALKDVDLEQYTVKPGDSLIRVVKSKYNLSDSDIHDEYIDLLKRFNPNLTSLDAIRPGQKVRLPVYSPQVVRLPLPPPPGREESPPPQPPSADASALMAQVSECLREMGLEWVAAGQHFIPLKSGGQITLNADTFPIVQVPNGFRVIVDCRGGLPERMASLITSSWSSYRVVRIGPKDSLRAAVGRVLAACGFPKVYGANEPLELPGDFPLRLKADWIVHTIGADLKGARFASITFLEHGSKRMPASIRDFLESMGVRAVEYPIEKSGASPPPKEPIRVGGDLRALVAEVLRLCGVPFSQGTEIPVFRGGKSPFNLILKADFLLSREGSEKIIDLSGMGSDIATLLKEHRFGVLTLGEQTAPADGLALLLRFLGIRFNDRPQTVLAADRDDSKNLSMTLEGIHFSSADGRRILFSPARLPLPLSGLVASRGYTVLELVEGGPPDPGPPRTSRPLFP